MIASLVAIAFAGQFSLSHLEYEMSCDTYPYGADATPVVQMRNGQQPTIDSLDSTHVWGHLNRTHFVWDSVGKCDNNKHHDLIFRKSFWSKQ